MGINYHLILFLKGVKKGNIYKKLLNNDLVKKNKCIITCNCNAWSNKEIIKYCVNNVYIKYFKNKIALKRTLLVLDHASMHDNFEILKFLFDKNINYVFIPKGLTSILQPLDISINRPFKDTVRHQYELACSVF